MDMYSEHKTTAFLIEMRRIWFEFEEGGLECYIELKQYWIHIDDWLNQNDETTWSAIWAIFYEMVAQSSPVKPSQAQFHFMLLWKH